VCARLCLSDQFLVRLCSCPLVYEPSVTWFVSCVCVFVYVLVCVCRISSLCVCARVPLYMNRLWLGLCRVCVCVCVCARLCLSDQFLVRLCSCPLVYEPSVTWFVSCVVCVACSLSLHRRTRRTTAFGFTLTFKGALCAYVIRLWVSYNQNDETLSRNSLRYLNKTSSTIAVN